MSASTSACNTSASILPELSRKISSINDADEGVSPDWSSSKLRHDPGLVSLLVSFADVRERSAACIGRSHAGREPSGPAVYGYPQTWKACWGQPLASSNLASSARRSYLLAGLRPASPRPVVFARGPSPPEP